jgi:hypothetical protein
MLVATRTVHEGEKITDYTGKSVSDEEVDNIPWADQAYMVGTGRRRVDGDRDHPGSLINDIRGVKVTAQSTRRRRKEPNCAFVWEDDGWIIEAIRKVKTGSEFLLDYGDDYWEREAKSKAQIYLRSIKGTERHEELKARRAATERVKYREDKEKREGEMSGVKRRKKRKRIIVTDSDDTESDWTNKEYE